MAGSQTGSAIPQSKFEIQVSAVGGTAGTAWTAICGEVTTVTVTGGEQPIGEIMTACGEGAIVLGSNKHSPYEIVVTAVYTEVATTEAFDFVHDRFQGGTKTLAVRWAPAGGIATVATNKLFATTNSGTAFEPVPIIRCLPPDLDASSANPATFQFAVRSPMLYETTTPGS
jgi:hypothetical protein